jgi:hypothetical protein
MNLQEGAVHVHEATSPLVGRSKVGETGHTGHIPCVVANPKDDPMSKFKRFARIAAGAVLATGIFAGAAAAPASAAPHETGTHMITMDTGWGG